MKPNAKQHAPRGTGHVSIAITEQCVNLEEAYGHICVLCNKCGRFSRKRKTAKEDA